MLWAPIFPTAGAEEAEIIDSAFRVLMALAVPVFAFVVSYLLYAVATFRSPDPSLEGPGLREHRPFVLTWLAITTALTVAVIIYPGAVDLNKIFARYREPADLVVRVEAFQWGWLVSYPEEGIPASSELVLPEGRRVRFEVTSRDVVHSFWVPAFRVKIDAVPGMTTTASVVPTRTGSRDRDPAFELRCAELCGLGHSVMVLPVRVVSPREFEAWLAEKKGS